MSTNLTENKKEGDSPDMVQFDQVAFKALFQNNYSSLCFYCKLKYGFDIYKAEDVVNAGFIKLWETRQTLTSGVSPKAYLYKIVDNSSLNILRHEKVKSQYADNFLKNISENISATSFDSIDIKQLHAAIDAAIADLPEKMRIIFELKRHDGLKYAEIADRLHISVKTVDTQMARAMIKLKEKLSGFLAVAGLLVSNLFMLLK